MANNAKPVTIKDFEKLANEREKAFEKKHGKRSNEEIEQLILQNKVSKMNIYGSDIDIPTLNEDYEALNLYKIPDSIREYANKEGAMPGIASPYSYAGSIGSVFAWHTEDCNFSSTSILLHGKPKIWYAIATSKSKDFEAFVTKHKLKSEKCNTSIRHKDTWYTPDLIRNSGIEVVKASK